MFPSSSCSCSFRCHSLCFPFLFCPFSLSDLLSLCPITKSSVSSRKSCLRSLPNARPTFSLRTRVVGTWPGQQAWRCALGLPVYVLCSGMARWHGPFVWCLGMHRLFSQDGCWCGCKIEVCLFIWSRSEIMWNNVVSLCISQRYSGKDQLLNSPKVCQVYIWKWNIADLALSVRTVV